MLDYLHSCLHSWQCRGNMTKYTAYIKLTRKTRLMIIVPTLVKIHKAVLCCPAVDVIQLTELIDRVIFKRCTLKFCDMTTNILTYIKTRCGHTKCIVTNNGGMVVHSKVAAA